jgi:hypothetical protein
MGFFPVKRPSLVFVACLALSAACTFTFAAAELPAFDFRNGNAATGGSISSIDTDYTIDCLAEYTVKTRGRASLSSCKSARVITPFGTLCAGTAAPFSLIKIAQPVKAPNNKNTILIKLRI